LIVTFGIFFGTSDGVAGPNATSGIAGLSGFTSLGGGGGGGGGVSVAIGGGGGGGGSGAGSGPHAAAAKTSAKDKGAKELRPCSVMVGGLQGFGLAEVFPESAWISRSFV
jgi:hypothetical protein